MSIGVPLDGIDREGLGGMGAEESRASRER